MRRPIDLTGQKFGLLTVLEDVGRKNNQVLWKCLCDCGNIVEIRSNNLRRGHTKSCGCYNSEKSSQRTYIDLTGQVFGRLTVLEDVGRKNNQVLWKCLCDCGNTIEIRAGHLRSGNTQSCGCYKQEQSGEKNHNWRGGITLLNDAVRTCIRYKEWRTIIFQRDSYTCQHCEDKRGGNLIAHHINRFSKIMEENHITTLEEAIQCEALWDVSNGITLCKKCHKKEHKKKPLTS